MSATALAALFGSLGSVAVLVLKWILDRRTADAVVDKTEAEAEKASAEAGRIIQTGYEKYVGLLEDRLKVRDDRLESLEERVKALEKALHASEAQVHGLNKLLRSTVRWALSLRVEIDRLGGTVPLMPADVEFALTTLDPE